MVSRAVLALLPLLLAATSPELRVRLVYDSSGTTCPSMDRLAAAVIARLGSDPFHEDAQQTVEVRVRRAQSSLAALVVRRGPRGEGGRRELSSPTLDCSELFRALELAVSIAIDPNAGLARPLPAAVAAPSQPAVAAPVVDSVGVRPAPDSPASPRHFYLGVAPTGSAGTGPSPVFGLALLAGLRLGLLELGAGGRVELPSTRVLSPGTITTQAIVSNLNACLAVSVLRGCALVELGALRVSSTGLVPGTQTTALLAGLGALLMVHLRLSEHFALRPFLAVAASLARTLVLADGSVAWGSSPVVGSLGLAVLVTSG